MKKQYKTLLDVFLVFLTMVLVCSIFIILKSFSPHKIAALSDGSKLELKIASYGTQYIFDPAVTKWWDPLLPGRDGFKAVQPMDRLALAYYYYPQKKSLISQVLISPSLHKIVLSDDTGSSCTPEEFELASLLNRTSTNIALNMLYRSFPRRGNTITVHIYDRRKIPPIAEFSFPNPIPKSSRNFPVWKQEQMPVSHTDDDMIVTAERFNFSKAAVEMVKSKAVQKNPKTNIYAFIPVRLQRMNSLIQLKLSSTARFLNNYKVRSAEISDPTGNNWMSDYIDQPKSGLPHSLISCVFTNNFVDKEPIAKLKLSFLRRGDGPIRPKDLVQVKGLKPLLRLRSSGRHSMTEPGPASDYGSVSHISLAGIPVDVCVLQDGVYQIPPLTHVQSDKDCVVLILPENAVSLFPRIKITNEKGEILIPDKKYDNELVITQYVPHLGGELMSSSTYYDEWNLYKQLPKSTPYFPAASAFEFKSLPRVLVYGLPSIPSDSILSLSIDADPLRTFEFVLPKPPDQLVN